MITYQDGRNDVIIIFVSRFVLSGRRKSLFIPTIASILTHTQ